MTIALADPADSDTVASLVNNLLNELSVEQGPFFPTEKLNKAAAELLQPESGLWSFLALVDGEAVGVINLNECCAIYAGGKFGEITELYVKPGYRSQNVGERLILRAKEFARERAWKLLEVGAPDVPRWNRTVSFYLKNGFSEVGPRLEIDV